MKKFCSVFMTAALVLCAAACDSESDDMNIPDAIVLADSSDSSISLAADGFDGVDVRFAATGAWEASAENNWVHVTPASGDSGDNTIRLSVDAYEKSSPRRSGVTIRTGTASQRITVTQLAYRDRLEADDDAPVTFAATGGTVEWGFTAAGAWEAVAQQEWISVSPESGAGGHRSINLTAAPSTSYEPRTGSVVLASGSLKLTVAVSQAPSEAEPRIVLANPSDGAIHCTGVSALPHEIRFESAGSWEAVSMDDWLTVTPASGDGGSDCCVTVEAADNPTQTERKGSIELRSKQVTCLIEVTQDAGPELPSYSSYLGVWLVKGPGTNGEERTYRVTIEEKEAGVSYNVKGWTQSELGYPYPFEMRFDPATGNVTIPLPQSNLGVYNSGRAYNVHIMPIRYSAAGYQFDVNGSGSMTGHMTPDGRVAWEFSQGIVSFEYILSYGFDYYYAGSSSDPSYQLNPVMERRTETQQYYFDYDVVPLQQHSVGNGVKLIIFGDGYTAAYDLDKGGKFERDIRTAYEEYFLVEPYKSLKPYFDVYMVAMASADQGATVLSYGVRRNTAFSSVIEGDGSTGISCNYDRVFNATMQAGLVKNSSELDNTAILLIINEDIYAGTCIMYYNATGYGRQIGMVPACTSFPMGRIIRHESGGHGWGSLADEYRYYAQTIPSSEKSSRQQWMSAGYFSNVTFQSQANAPWAHYYTRPGYGMVGYYEGGLLYYYGVWRPEQISCMEDNRDYFNAPSRERIYRRTIETAGETFSMEKFLEYDKINLSSSAQTIAGRNYVERPMPPLAPPIMMDHAPTDEEIRAACEPKPIPAGLIIKSGNSW